MRNFWRLYGYVIYGWSLLITVGIILGGLFGIGFFAIGYLTTLIPVVY